MNWIQIQLNSIELNFKCTNFKWDANWWTKYWKYVHEYDVRKQNVFKNTNPKMSQTNSSLELFKRQLMTYEI